MRACAWWSLKDSDDDGIDDKNEIDGYPVRLRSTGLTIVVKTSPTDADSDHDTVEDGLERDLGGNPTQPDDKEMFSDDDGDGLANVEEVDGYDIKVFAVSTGGCAHVCGEGPFELRHVSSDKTVADTDGDGLSDGEEAARGTDPRNKDTDRDTLSDAAEVLGFALRDLGVITLSPTHADTDHSSRWAENAR